MTLTHLSGTGRSVTVEGDSLTVHQLVIHHPEAAAFIRARLDEFGQEAADDLVRRSLPVGLVALSMGTAAVDTGAITRTLDHFADRVNAKSEAALADLNKTLTRLRAAEETVARAASSVLENLPAQVETALAGQAGNVRANVAEAARAVQSRRHAGDPPGAVQERRIRPRRDVPRSRWARADASPGPPRRPASGAAPDAPVTGSLP
jgi:hypothetical protein